jgi:hypothetical protein
LLQRLVYAGDMIGAAITPLGAALLFVAMLASLRDSLQRWLVAIFVVPLGLAWAMAFSYDLRNLAIIVPWIGIASGHGLMQIASWATSARRLRPIVPQSIQCRAAGQAATRPFRWLTATASLGPGSDAAADILDRTTQMARLPRGNQFQCFLRVGHVVGLLALVLISICWCVSNKTLLDCQLRQQRMAGVTELNRQLYAYAADHPDRAMIATDYQAMRWLPELGRRSVVCTCHEISAFRQTFDRPEVHYVLVRIQGAAADVRRFLEGGSATRLIFEDHGFSFYEKWPDPQAKVTAVP